MNLTLMRNMNMGINIPDRVNDFLEDVRKNGGLINDMNFDRVAAEVFKRQIKELIEECARIAESFWLEEAGEMSNEYRIAAKIRALDS